MPGVFFRARRGSGTVILKEDVLEPLGLEERMGAADQIGLEHDDEPLYQARLELYTGPDLARGFEAATRFLREHGAGAFDKLRKNGLDVDLLVTGASDGSGVLPGAPLELPAALLLACGERELPISLEFR